jgi:hypothetical protein
MSIALNLLLNLYNNNNNNNNNNNIYPIGFYERLRLMEGKAHEKDPRSG